MISLPLTPRHIAVAYDRRVMEIIRSEIANNDVVTLNCGQIQNAMRSIYASFPPGADDVAFINDIWNKITRRGGETENTRMRLQLQFLLPTHRFAFAKMSPPLL